MSKIRHLQMLLKDIFDEFTPQFVNKMYWLQLQYRVEKGRRILVIVQIFRKNGEKAIMKSAMYVILRKRFGFSKSILVRIGSNFSTVVCVIVMYLCV